jgi:hypothetical protein
MEEFDPELGVIANLSALENGASAALLCMLPFVAAVWAACGLAGHSQSPRATESPEEGAARRVAELERRIGQQAVNIDFGEELPSAVKGNNKLD